MRIDLSQEAEPLPESGRAKKRRPASLVPSSCSRNPSGEDCAQSSGAKAQVCKLATQALQLPEVRHEKVGALRQAILRGTYQPDVEQVAHELFAHMLVESAT